jgi:hypothetical protein
LTYEMFARFLVPEEVTWSPFEVQLDKIWTPASGLNVMVVGVHTHRELPHGLS